MSEIRKRYQELVEKTHNGGLSKTEYAEFSRLHAVLKDVNAQLAQDSSLTQQQKEISEQRNKTIWTQICSTQVDGKFVTDNQANYQIVSQWPNPGEQIKDYRAWFAQVLTENPSLKNSLTWFVPLTAQQKQKQDREHAQGLRQRFASVCRENGISEAEANFNIWSNASDSTIVHIQGKPCVYDQTTEDYLELLPASQEELNKWARERDAQHQDALKNAAARNDISALRQMAQLERQHGKKTQAQLQTEVNLLNDFGKFQEYNLPPLPEQWRGKSLDPSFIRAASRETLKQIGIRHGLARVNARLLGYDEAFFNNWSAKLADLQFQLYGTRSYAF